MGITDVLLTPIPLSWGTVLKHKMYGGKNGMNQAHPHKSVLWGKMRLFVFGSFFNLKACTPSYINLPELLLVY